MTMFSPNTSDIDKKLQEVEDEDLRDYMKLQDYSDKEIKSLSEILICTTR